MTYLNLKNKSSTWLEYFKKYWVSSPTIGVGKCRHKQSCWDLSLRKNIMSWPCSRLLVREVLYVVFGCLILWWLHIPFLLFSDSLNYYICAFTWHLMCSFCSWPGNLACGSYVDHVLKQILPHGVEVPSSFETIVKYSSHCHVLPSFSYLPYIFRVLFIAFTCIRFFSYMAFRSAWFCVLYWS